MQEKHHKKKESNIEKMKNKQEDILPEYDFISGTRGKYAKRFAKSTNIVVLEPDMAKIFHDSESVNETLRAIAKIAQRSKKRLAA